MPAVLDRPPTVPPPTAPAPRRPSWRDRLPWAKPRTRIAAPTDDGELVLDNATPDAWSVHLGYHDLGVVAAGSQRTVRVVKTGMLTARQVDAPIGGDYLIAYLRPAVRTVRIRRTVVNGAPLFDLQLLEAAGQAAAP